MLDQRAAPGRDGNPRRSSRTRCQICGRFTQAGIAECARCVARRGTTPAPPNPTEAQVPVAPHVAATAPDVVHAASDANRQDILERTRRDYVVPRPSELDPRSGPARHFMQAHPSAAGTSLARRRRTAGPRSTRSIGRLERSLLRLVSVVMVAAIAIAAATAISVLLSSLGP
jgi:hypothetical protein